MKCAFCKTKFPNCPQVYTYHSKHGQPFLLCLKCHRGRYITKKQAREILVRCKIKPIVVKAGQLTSKAMAESAKATGKILKGTTKIVFKVGKFFVVGTIKLGVKTVKATYKATIKVNGKKVEGHIKLRPTGHIKDIEIPQRGVATIVKEAKTNGTMEKPREIATATPKFSVNGRAELTGWELPIYERERIMARRY